MSASATVAAPPSPAELAALGAVKVTLDRERWLIFDLDALYLLEQATGANALGTDLFQPLTATNLRLLLWAGLRREDPKLTIDEIGPWLARHETDRIREVSSAVAKAWNIQRPEPKADPPVAGESSEPSTSGSSPAEQGSTTSAA